jgi:hypothetical protein
MSFEGMVVLDVRVKQTDRDGNETYERIMNLGPRNSNIIDITTYDGITTLLGILGKKKNEVNTIIREIKSMFKMPKSKLNSKISTMINLIQLHEILQKLNVDYVNIVDYSCRSCDTELTKTQIDEIYKKEQSRAHEMAVSTKLGGRTIRKRKRHGKTRKRPIKK